MVFLKRLCIAITLCANLFTISAAVAASSEIGMVTGPQTGTYIRFGHDISRISEPFGVSVNVKESNGSIENIKRINSSENAALGIVQSDLLGFLQRSTDAESKRLAKDLRMIFPFYREEIHLFARTSVTQLADLNGKRVIVGAQGSGHWLTAMNILTMMGISPAQILRLPPAEAVVAVLQNRADAMFFVGGKPVKLFQNLQDLNTMENPEYQQLLKQVHFVPMVEEPLLREYSRSTITPAEYSFLSQATPTVAVTAVLVSHDFSDAKNGYAKKRCDEIGKIGMAIRTSMDQLRRIGHEKWQEVDLDANIGNWKKDSCVNAAQHASPAEGASPFEHELLKTIEKRW